MSKLFFPDTNCRDTCSAHILTGVAGTLLLETPLPTSFAMETDLMGSRGGMEVHEVFNGRTIASGEGSRLALSSVVGSLIID